MIEILADTPMGQEITDRLVDDKRKLREENERLKRETYE